MMLAQRTRRRLYIWAISTLVGGAIGVMYSLLIGGQAKFGFPIGCAIVGGITGFELMFVRQPVGAWLRRLALLPFITISTLFWTAIIAVSLQIVPRLLGLGEAYGEENRVTTFQQDMVFSLAIAFALNSVLRIRSLVGGRVLINFLLGRYHRPLREQRVFLFLDLANSTHFSEELGDLQVQSLIGRFFFDIARPIAEHGGETHRYIGDEVVVTWPLSVATTDARCLECVFDIQNSSPPSRRATKRILAWCHDFGLECTPGLSSPAKSETINGRSCTLAIPSTPLPGSSPCARKRRRIFLSLEIC